MSLRVVTLAGELVCESEPRHGRLADGVPPGGLYDPQTARLLQAWWGVEGPCWELRGGEVVLEATTPVSVGWAGAATAHDSDRAVLKAGETIRLAPRRPGATLAIVSASPWRSRPGLRANVGTELEGGGSGPLPPKGKPDSGLPETISSVIRYLPRQSTVPLSGRWDVSVRADRMGILLNGKQVFRIAHGRSTPVGIGTIQCPGENQIIVVGPDGPTVGGYPVLGSVIRADRPRLARLAPGDPVEFVGVSLSEAESLWREAQASLADQIRRITSLRKALG